MAETPASPCRIPKRHQAAHRAAARAAAKVSGGRNAHPPCLKALGVNKGVLATCRNDAIIHANVGHLAIDQQLPPALVNAVIGGLNKISLPNWVPGIGGKGINIPKIPTLWKGSNYTMGGLTLVGEQGPELVNMPRGASVTPHYKTEQMLNNASGPVELVLKIDNFYNNTANDIEKIADELAYLIRRKKIALGGV